MNPISTYRIQFHKEFTFDDFEKIIPYLHKLGVGTIYASPVFESVPCSVHGYDGVHPHRINPEIGTEEQLRDITQRLKEQGINWLQDIVPNHMAFHPNNEWLMDVLEKGKQSIYASFFDIALYTPSADARIMVPFLGASLEEVIKKDELEVAYENQHFVFRYYGNTYPLHPKSYVTILQAIGDDSLETVKQLADQISSLADGRTYLEQWNKLRLHLKTLMEDNVAKAYIKNCIETVNSKPGLLQQIAEEQMYRLCHWQETDYQINYRRFFTVNGLICLNMHDTEVFDQYHKAIKQLVDDHVFQGLRIDHIDGLYDPTTYLQQLREIAGEETYIIVEKILEQGEHLPKQWPIQGNTGYDFLSMVNNVFTNTNSRRTFSKFYDKLTNNNTSITQQLYEKKAYILYTHMGGELENLYQLFMQSNLVQKEDYAQMRTEDIKTVIGEFLIQCPVYRYYANSFPLLKDQAAEVKDMLRRIRRSRHDLTPAVKLLEDVLLHKPNEHHKEYNRNVLHFYQRCMQFTGPLMAKGVEDTLMYTYNRFIDHNEVGDSPEAFGSSLKEFHQQMKERQQQWPLSVNATSTHDTKRGEGVRARLNVLTEMADEWITHVQEWMEMNADLKTNGAPDVNDEYFIYQTLTGAYPMPGTHDDNIQSRLEEYLEKALREAKTHSNWTTPNIEYEDATKAFATGLLNTARPFWSSFTAFQQSVAEYGIHNSLSQVLLKFTCPGVPDVYQGTELWDLSLVDPDNRRPVDYERRMQYLSEIQSSSIDEQETLVTTLWQNRYNGQVKLWLINNLMKERKYNADLFMHGEYVPLHVEGKYRRHILAFARQHQHKWYVVAVPVNTFPLCKEQNVDLVELDWKDTRINLPREAPGTWQNILVNGEAKHSKDLLVKDLFTHVPFALLKLTSVHERSSGVLMHITSLPSPFGIGDLGPEAIAFADFLHRSNQKYWQLLPLNPTEEGQGNSPYSSLSSKAGNPLLISPALLAQEGLLDEEDLKAYHMPVLGTTNYGEAKHAKDELFAKAWQTFKAGEFIDLTHAFASFCNAEATWLNDFAVFMLLKNMHSGKPWFEWPEEYKLYHPAEIEKLAKTYADDIEEIKWLQFIFSAQWKKLRSYCNSKGIQMFGDMPYYISYDSVDVWSDREIFAIDDDGKMTGVAGVPPDAFSADGQLWGMPVFKWDVLKSRNYDWWIQRFKRNMELFDIVRLDHFRAFYDYWEVPAKENTAKIGEWKLGPGADLFNTVIKELGSLPFIAEDLGDINDAVYELRDNFKLPGMKILQFAFGDDMDNSIHAPHNYTENFIVYTGTHDNNTVRGWFRTEVDQANRQRLEHYLEDIVREEDVHITLAELAYKSRAKSVILPMQDVLGLDESARMNTPSSGNNNWGWRMLPEQLNTAIEKMLKRWTRKYNR